MSCYMKIAGSAPFCTLAGPFPATSFVPRSVLGRSLTGGGFFLLNSMGSKYSTIRVLVDVETLNPSWRRGNGKWWERQLDPCFVYHVILPGAGWGISHRILEVSLLEKGKNYGYDMYFGRWLWDDFCGYLAFE